MPSKAPAACEKVDLLLYRDRVKSNEKCCRHASKHFYLGARAQVIIAMREYRASICSEGTSAAASMLLRRRACGAYAPVINGRVQDDVRAATRMSMGDFEYARANSRVAADSTMTGRFLL